MTKNMMNPLVKEIYLAYHKYKNDLRNVWIRYRSQENRIDIFPIDVLDKYPGIGEAHGEFMSLYEGLRISEPGIKARTAINARLSRYENLIKSSVKNGSNP